MKLCERIKSLRLQRDMTQKELGQLLDVSLVTIGGWENGTRKPSADALIALSRALDTTADYLLGINVPSNTAGAPLDRYEKNLLSDYRTLDAYGKRAVRAVCAVEKERVGRKPTEVAPKVTLRPARINSPRFIPKFFTPAAAGVAFPIDGNDFEMIPADDNTPRDADFAVKIQGDSMEPYIHDGDTVFVKKDAELSIGDIGIFCVDGAIYCKQYFLDENQNLVLLSANPQLQSANVFVSRDSGADVRCYGKVLLRCHVKLPNVTPSPF